MISDPRHLTDDQLVEISLKLTETTSNSEHLAACPRCSHRKARLTQLLTDITDAAADETDIVFPPERLAKQRARILQRIEQDGRPARIIAFPASAAEATVTRRRPATRWLAAAAAAGLLVGLVAGHYTRQVPVVVSEQVGTESFARQGMALRAASSTVSDDEFIGQVETALDSPSAAVLVPLDELTPLEWDTQ